MEKPNEIEPVKSGELFTPEEQRTAVYEPSGVLDDTALAESPNSPKKVH